MNAGASSDLKIGGSKNLFPGPTHPSRFFMRVAYLPLSIHCDGNGD